MFLGVLCNASEPSLFQFHGDSVSSNDFFKVFEKNFIVFLFKPSCEDGVFVVRYSGK